MNFRVYVTPSARKDLENAKNFYAQISPHLGDYCQEALLTDISSLQFYAGIHVKIFGYNRLLSQRFPYDLLPVVRCKCCRCCDTRDKT